MRLDLRTRIMAAILAAVVATDLLAAWAVNDRILAGARREADTQARAHAARTRALYAERGATLAAEGEAVSLYPAVITALAEGNAQPLLRWSGQVAALQAIAVTVTDAAGRVIARGHAPGQAGDDLAPRLEGLRLALAGQKVSGTEAGDELGLALRGYAPVLRDGQVVGAVMVAERFDDRLLGRLAGRADTSGGGSAGDGAAARDGSGGARAEVRPATGAPGADGQRRGASEGCDVLPGAAGTCHFPLASPAGRPAATLALTVPLADVERARADAQRALWLTGALVLAAGAAAAWLLARSLAGPLAQLTAAAHRIAAGDYDRTAGPAAGGRRADEIGVLARAFDTMRAQVAAATGALRHERDVLDAVLESVGDGILMADPAGQVVVANGRWTALLGGAAGEWLPAAAHLTRVGGGSGTLESAARAWLASGDQAATADFEHVGPPYRRFRCYTAPVRRRDGAAIGRIFVLRDVTRESEAERMRTALVSTVSHELRSPLTAIAGYTATLLNDGPWDAPTEREFLEIVAQSAERLSRLVDNLLDAAKMEAGVLALEREPVRVERIAERVVAHRRSLAPQHTLRVEAQPDLPLAHADPLRVEQVIANLVENAIKYSPNGGPVTVRITASPRLPLRERGPRGEGNEPPPWATTPPLPLRERGPGGEGPAMLTVSVTDRGAGIAADHAERLFERFYRVDNALARTTKGLGLGLFICKSLVEAHGGRIWVESAPGAGSTFSFTLPAYVDQEQRAPAGRGAQGEPATRSGRVAVEAAR
jgi:signal transduction histidine kinase